VDDRYWWRSLRYTFIQDSERYWFDRSNLAWTLHAFLCAVAGATVTRTAPIKPATLGTYAVKLSSGTFSTSKPSVEYGDVRMRDPYPSPWLMDWLLYNVGMRLVRDPDGSITITSYADSVKAITANEKHLLPTVAKNPPKLGLRDRFSGGEFLLGTDQPVFDSKNKESDNPVLLPTIHRVWAGPTVQGPFALLANGSIDIKTSDLAGFNPGTDPKTGNHIPAVRGNGTVRDYWDTVYPIQITFTPPNTYTQLNIPSQLATRMALDYCFYQASNLDVKYSGILPWTKDGISDSVEYIYRENEVSTRIQRHAFEGSDPGFYCHGWLPPVNLLGSPITYPPLL